MSDIDLTEAVDLAYDESFSERVTAFASGDFDTDEQFALTRRIVTLAAPLIEAAVREQVAREIEAVRDVPFAMVHGRIAVSSAARIARGGVR